ncbi:MAG: hypothetical protein ACI9R3_003314 [Verrucomicrobiales bacterium]|jgi:hypothetical protein
MKLTESKILAVAAAVATALLSLPFLISDARADFAKAPASFQGDAMMIHLEEGVRRVRLQQWDAASETWQLLQLAHLKGDAGYIKLRLPDGASMDTIKVEVSLTDPFPYSFYTGKSSFGQSTDINGAISGPNRGGGLAVDANEGGAPEADDGGGAEVVESDIWKIVDDRLYYFNQARGLQLFDLTNEQAGPEKIASLRMPGVGEQMYVLDDRYTLLLAAWRTWNQSEIILTEYDADNGLREARRFPLPGSIVESRLIGKQLYVVTRFSEYNRIEVPSEDEEGGTDEEWVYKTGLDLSIIDFTDPANPVEKTGLQLAEQDSWGYYNAQVAATSTHLLVSTMINSRNYNQSKLFVIDIADQQKDPALVAEIPLKGWIADKFKMRVVDDVITTVSQINDWRERRFETIVETFRLDATRKGGFEKLDDVSMGLGEQLFATRFHGDRLYVVTFERTDPFWVVDIADPKDLKILGELEVPGFSQYLEPWGDLVIAIGVEDRVVTASIFDASDPQHPSLLSRVNIGEGYSWSEANYDEKAVSFNAEEGILLVPYQSYHEGTVEKNVQIIDVTRELLTKRGTIAHDFTPRRAGLWQDNIVSVSGRELLIVDASDRDNPVTISETVIAWSTDRLLKVGDYLLQIEEGYAWDSQPNNALRVTTVADPDTTIAELALDNGSIIGTEHRNGLLHVLSSRTDYLTEEDAEGNQVTRTERALIASVVDVSDITAPRILGQARKTDDIGNQWYYGTSNMKAVWLPGGEIAWVTSDPGSNWWGRWGGWFDDDIDVAIAFFYQMQAELHIVSVADPAAPSFLSSTTVTAENSWSYSPGFLIAENQIGFTYEESSWIKSEKRYLQKHTLRVIDVTNPSAPVTSKNISISGKLASVTDVENGTVLLTESQQSAVEETPTERWWQDGYVQAAIYDGINVFLVDEAKIENGAHATNAYNGTASFRQLSTEQDGIHIQGLAWDAATGKFSKPITLPVERWNSQLAIVDDLLLGWEYPSTLNATDITDPLAPGETQSFEVGYSIWGRLDRTHVERSIGAWIPTGSYGVESIDFNGAFASAEVAQQREAREEILEWITIPPESMRLVDADAPDFVGNVGDIQWRYVPAPDPVPFGDWMAGYFDDTATADPEITGLAADPDADGMSNALEYLFGTSPAAATAQPITINRSDEDSGITAEFPLNPLSTPLAWHFETSTDLKTWTPGDDNTLSQSGLGAKIALDPSASERYLRLVVIP